MFSYGRATDEKKENDKELSIQVYSGASRHQSQHQPAEHALVWRHICIFLILVFFAFPISSVLTRRKPAPELSAKSRGVQETRLPLYTSTKKDTVRDEEKIEIATAGELKLTEINNLWEEKQEAEKMWREALEKEEAEQREKRVEYFKLNATLVENQAKQIIEAETLQFFRNVMKFKSERNDGNVNIQSCEQVPDCIQFGWFQQLLPEGENMCITLLILDKLNAKCKLDPSSVDVIVPISTTDVFGQRYRGGHVEDDFTNSNFICRLINSKKPARRPDPAARAATEYERQQQYGAAVNKEAFTYCDAIAIVGKVVKSSS
jgi:hypothetical protein